MNESHLPVYVARTQVASAIQVIAQVARFPDGSRRVKSIAEVLGLDKNEKYKVRTIFDFVTEKRDAEGKIVGKLLWTGRRSRFARDVQQMCSPQEIALTEEIWRLQEKK